MARKPRKPRSMHVDTGPRTYLAADGTIHEYQQALLRRSYRNAQGMPVKETLANLSMLPENAVDALRKSLAGKTLVEADAEFAIDRVVAHGHVAAVHAMASMLKFDELLGPRHRERDLAYALIISRVVAPQSTTSTIRWWADTSLGTDLDIVATDTHELYAAMDWLLSRQDRIETRLADRHLTPGGTAIFDLSGAHLAVPRGEPAEFGHSPSGKSGLPRIEFGLLADIDGRPVAIRVLTGSTSDAQLFLDAISAVRDRFGPRNLIMAGGRGMITDARVDELKAQPDLYWLTELPAPAVAAMAGRTGPPWLSQFDQRHVAEITHPAFPGERLVYCRTPAEAGERARIRDTLLQATERELDGIAALVTAGRLRGAARIGNRAREAGHKNKVGKHFITIITDDGFSYRRNTESIAAAAALDEIRVIRTSVDPAALGTGDIVDKYQNLAHIERDFGPIKFDDLGPLPAPHHFTDRVRAHLLLDMLAAYLNWHLRRKLAPLIVAEENIPQPGDPGTPIRPAPDVLAIDQAQENRDGLPKYDYPGLIAHLGQLTRNTVSFTGRRFEKITSPTPVQRRVFELLNTSIPPTLDGM